MKQIKIFSPGILFCFLIAIPAYFLGRVFPVIGGPVFGILMGMAMTMVLKFEKIDCLLSGGLKYTSKNLLQYAIILLGFEMNLFQVIKVGSQTLYIMLFTLTTSFLTAYFVGKVLRINGKMTTLIGVGTSICGGSAIAATVPVIQAKDKDVAQAMSTIFLFNIVAVFIFPALGHLLGMSDVGFGMWAGTAINDTSSVVAAATSWSTVAQNNTALSMATIVKLTRTLMIVPITLVLAIYTVRKRNAAGGSSFQISRIFPWFVIGFVSAALINTFAHIPVSFSHLLVTIGKFIIIMAMVAIGLNTNFKRLITNGLKPIFLGLCCWFAVAAISLVVQKVLEIW
jgi:uncharacterized integral membrane protein (TIGR00698 family)